MDHRYLRVYPCQRLKIDDVPVLSFDEFRHIALEKTRNEERVISFFGQPRDACVFLFMVLAHDRQGYLEIISTPVKDSFPSLTPQLPQLNWFEREIAQLCGVRPDGHPWLKPIRPSVFNQQPALVAPGDVSCFLDDDFFKVGGEEVHEVAVGPVHAGIIEPGHFRFQCHGEHVFHLEISLGYQHRGVERALIGGPDKRTIHYMETLCGDTTIGHSLAYCQAMEGLSDCEVPLRAAALRGVMLELERLANHTGDLGALANDTGYLPAASYCGRLRGDFLNMSALICGNRFGRNMIRPGGVVFDVDDKIVSELKKRLKETYADVENAVSLLWDTSSVVDRFEGTGVVTRKTALDLGLVGLVARACGIERDIRFDFPSGIFRFSQIPVSTCSSGDVFARAFVRWLEIQRSVDFIQHQLSHLPDGAVFVSMSPPKKREMAVSLVEGWRGEICHVALTDENAGFSQYKIIDPSFHNWMGLAMSLRGEEISNFPLCNKSFNLSYCGHDL